jgi:rubrerythrin
MTAVDNDLAQMDSVATLMRHALTMEREAAERYAELGEQMARHHNAPVAELFRRLAAIEKAHVLELEAQCAGMKLPDIAPWDYQWPGGESPETIAYDRVRYHMSARDAVLLALEHERAAADFYASVVASAPAADVRQMAEQFYNEELEHVGWLEGWLAKAGAEERVRIDDPDPPNSLE